MRGPLNINVAYFLLHTSSKRSFSFSAQLHISEMSLLVS